MLKHVTPSDPAATIPDPERGRDLPPDGAVVTWSAYWAGRALRDEITVREPDPAPAEPDTDAASEAMAVAPEATEAPASA